MGQPDWYTQSLKYYPLNITLNQNQQDNWESPKCRGCSLSLCPINYALEMSIRIWPEEAKENNLKHQWDLEGGWEFCLHLVSNVQETFKRRDILPIAVSPVERSQLLLTQKNNVGQRWKQLVCIKYMWHNFIFVFFKNYFPNFRFLRSIRIIHNNIF